MSRKGKWVSLQPMNNARVKELEGKFRVFAHSFLTGSLWGQDNGLSGGFVGWVIVESREYHSSITLKLSKDSKTWVVEDQGGDVSKVTAMLAQEGLTFKQ